MEEDANRRLDKEILRFKTLLRQSANTGRDFSREIQMQKVVLSRLGLSDGDILNLIHDRHGRASIQIAKDRRKDIVGKFREAEATKRSPTSTFPPPPSKASYGKATAEPKAGANGSGAGAGAAKAGLLILYGINKSGRIVHSDYAVQGDQYQCPACRVPLDNRTDHSRTKVYFAHKSDTPCSYESIRRATARYLIAKVIDEQADPTMKTLIALDCRCIGCTRVFQQFLPKTTFTGARVSERIGAQVWDVVALRGTEPVLAIAVGGADVDVANSVDGKAVPWMELIAADIVQNPYWWKPARAHLKPVRCPSCKPPLRKNVGRGKR